MNLEGKKTNNSQPSDVTFVLFPLPAKRLAEDSSRHVPLIEGGGPLLGQHGVGALDGAAILARDGVHVARFDDVHRRRHNGGAEAGGEGGREVARHVVCDRGEGGGAEKRHGGRVRYTRDLSEPTRRPLPSSGDASARKLLARHQLVVQDALLDDVIGDRLAAIHDGVASDVGQTTCTATPQSTPKA